MSDKFEFTDRYKATGTPYPDPKTCCEWCDGMGCAPIQVNELNEEACKSKFGTLVVIGQKDSERNPMKDHGWVIVRCPECLGSRVKPTDKGNDTDA